MWYTRNARRRDLAATFAILLLIVGPTGASVGDRLPEFKACVKVCLRKTTRGLEESWLTEDRTV